MSQSTVTGRDHHARWKGRMYAKVFASLFEGSFYGAGPIRYAVWIYLLAKANADGIVSCNTKALSGTLGCSQEEVAEALAWLQSPDAESRNPDHEGRRIEALSPYEYAILNYAYYRDLKTREMERENARERQKRRRSRLSQMSRQSDKEVPPEVASTTEGEQPSAPIVAAVVPVKAKSWSTEACEDWSEFSGGVAPGGKIGAALKPLVAKVARERNLDERTAWERIRPHWRAFCQSPARKFGPHSFAENPRQVFEAATNGGKPTVGEIALRELEAARAARGAE